MDRRSVIRLAASGVVLGSAAGVATGSTEDQFNAHLTPARGTETKARGKAVFDLGSGGNELEYTLVVANIRDVTEAHMHLHLVGIPENPPPDDLVAWLYPEAGSSSEHIPGRFSGVLAEGTITDADVLEADGDFDGSLDDLVEAMRRGDAFVRVNTDRYPDGAIVGDVR